MTALSKDLPFFHEDKNAQTLPSLRTYRTLGNTGLKVSPIAYGAGTFGDAWGEAWSSGKTQAEAIFNHYVNAGGNFFDTSDVYQDGQSEQWLGEFTRNAGNRDRLVISTKGTQNQYANDLNGGGNGRKHIIKAVEASLKRLNTDYIDLYFLHQCDRFTPPEEVLSTFEVLIQQGKIRHYGLSNFPAWYTTKLQLLAYQSFRNPIAAIQNQYSLVARHSDYEHLPMCQHFDIGFMAWSPLANGLLTGKYQVDELGSLTGQGRLTDTWTTDPSVAHMATSQNISVIKTLIEIAQASGHTPSQIALNWLVKHQGLTSLVIGARKLTQLKENLAALEFELTAEQTHTLDQVSQPLAISPYNYHTAEMQSLIHTGTRIEKL
ncbi:MULTISPECIES: aldo/keto reductase [unclassified Pseudoalteromonas]|uniref:aldo/keto reductase n=1 Tax=unclassified Pseudoalteromonas TaxID=194690 RepID=UPI002097ED6C|nr:aldo/keto reductase [Pseudoalteromonas sp. XMcav2-N]MCO7189295.1 aldo/keto reductase [Pseudoalteromonas sp. XMcav2-N]